jgi:hypothetical protein
MRDARSIRRGAVLAAAVSAIVLHAAKVRAQSDDDLAAARRLFADAVADQDAKRFDTALEKFRRIDAVKDTANVRYRIASCLEALGKRADALANYQAAERLGAGEHGATEVVRAASARASDIDRVLPRLVVVLPADAPAGTQVRVDDSPVDPGGMHDGLVLDPGLHTITATATGDAPFRTGVTLPEGGRVSIAVTLERLPPSPPEPSTGPAPPPPPPPALGESGGAPASAWVAFAVGGVLAAGAITSFALRASNLATLNRDCQGAGGGGALSCPQSRSDEVDTARNAALVEGPLGIGLAAGAVVAGALGVWWVASSHGGGVRVTPAVTGTGGGILVGGTLGR